MNSAKPLPVAPDHSRDTLLREQAYLTVKSLILRGHLSQLPFLSSRSLAKHLGMSITPVRSAVERLETEGLLSIGPQRGLVINELTTNEIVDHFEIRQALETLVVRKLAGRVTPEQAAALRTNLAAHEESFRAGELETYIHRDGAFHLMLAEFSGNADVKRVLEQLRDRIFRVVLRVIEHVPQRMKESIDEHRQILELLEAGRGVHAAALMTKHLQSGLKSLAPGYQQEDFST